MSNGGLLTERTCENQLRLSDGPGDRSWMIEEYGRRLIVEPLPPRVDLPA